MKLVHVRGRYHPRKTFPDKTKSDLEMSSVAPMNDARSPRSALPDIGVEDDEDVVVP